MPILSRRRAPVNRHHQRPANGAVLWEGPSQIDGRPIVVIAVGLRRKSNNAKTGNMLQTYILRSDIDPLEALYSGRDSSVCGDCPLRGYYGRRRGCYVNVHQAPLMVWRAYKRGSYPKVNDTQVRRLLAGCVVRFGSYGDPTAAPYHVWSNIASVAKHAGYTHQWQVPRFWRFRRLIMASVHDIRQRDIAHACGWRTFRMLPPGSKPDRGETVCPASSKKLTCLQCRRCNGASKLPSVVIQEHGSPRTLRALQLLRE